MQQLIAALAWMGMLAATGIAAAADDEWKAAENRLFDTGSWTVQVYGSGTFGDDDHGNMYALHAGVGYFFRDDVSINLDGLFGAAETGSVSGDDDGVVGGADLLLRWHWLQKDRWSLFLDGGAGFQLADTNFPSDSHHNFRLLLGVGATCHLRDQMHLLLGIRYMHVSNARTTDGNDGLDAAQAFAGLMWGF